MIDTDVLEHIRYRSDSTIIYEAIVRAAHAGRVQTVRQVFGELKKHPVPYGVLKPHESKFLVPTQVQYSAAVQDKLDLINRYARFLWPTSGGKNPDPADPWLVAVCAAYGYTLVTDENPLSPVRIPAACGCPHINAKWKSGPHFFIETGIVTNIDPSHISAHAFFNMGGPLT